MKNISTKVIACLPTKRLTAAKLAMAIALVCGCALTTPGYATIIVFDNIEGNGDDTVDDTPGGLGVGSIATPYAGFNFEGTVANNYFGVLDLSVTNDDNDGDGTVGVDEMVVGDLPGLSQADGDDQWSVTYGGAIAAGNYSITLQLVDYNNDPFREVSAVSLGGLTATADASNPPPLTDDQDGLFSYSFSVAAGATEIGNALALIVETDQPGTSNVGFDNVQIEFKPVPEPGTALLGMLCGLFAYTIRRTRK